VTCPKGKKKEMSCLIIIGDLPRKKDGLIVMGDLPKGKKKENGDLIIIGDLPRWKNGLIIMKDLPRQKNTENWSHCNEWATQVRKERLVSL
jgi:hypothetical protein